MIRLLRKGSQVSLVVRSSTTSMLKGKMNVSMAVTSSDLPCQLLIKSIPALLDTQTLQTQLIT